jgi:hypothetical protein
MAEYKRTCDMNVFMRYEFLKGDCFYKPTRKLMTPYIESYINDHESMNIEKLKG